MRKWLYRFLGVMIFLILALIGSCFILSKSRPTGKASVAADTMARRVEQAINKKAWDEIGAIQWSHGDRQQHLWDKQRMLARVTWNKKRNVAHFPLGTPESGLVSVAGKPVTDTAQKTKLLKRAYAYWANDSFWLNPMAKMFDDGTTRKIVQWKGKPQLMVEYSSGGVTPGDAYLYVLGKDYLPIRWHMWVKIIPVKGAAASFEDWKTLYNGARISTRHELFSMITLKLINIKAAENVQKLTGSDPFAALVRMQNPLAQPPTTPGGPSTSQPNPTTQSAPPAKQPGATPGKTMPLRNKVDPSKTPPGAGLTGLED